MFSGKSFVCEFYKEEQMIRTRGILDRTLASSQLPLKFFSHTHSHPVSLSVGCLLHIKRFTVGDHRDLYPRVYIFRAGT
jgi:hypothetical protein